MKQIYLLLTIIGFISPSILACIETIETGNILLYSNPIATIEGMFANRISTIFMIDLFFSVFVFFIWTYSECKKYKINKMGVIWAATLLFGLAGGFPLFLYLKEKTKQPT